MSAADTGMTGKGNFLLRCEDTHAIAGAGIARRQQKGRFHQIGPARVALHLRIAPAACIHYDAEVIATAGAGGEDIQMHIADRVHTARRQGRHGLIAHSSRRQLGP